MPSTTTTTALYDFAQEMEKQLSRQVRQEGLFGESGWCLVRYYRELIDHVYNEAEGVNSAPSLSELEARSKLAGIYENFQADLKRIVQRGLPPLPESSRLSISDDEGSVLDDIASVYYDDLEESSPEPEDLPHTPSRMSPTSVRSSIPSMIMSDDSSFLNLATPLPDRPCNPTPNATGDDKFSQIPFTPLPKHGFPGTYNPEPYAELFLSKGVPYEAQFVNLDSLDPRILLSSFKKSPKDRKSLPALPRVPNTPIGSESPEGGAKKKMKKKRSFWKRPSSSSSNDGEKKKEKSAKKEREELKAPTFWCPM